MLRGVNLGPHRRMKMDALRTVYESLGLRDPLTYIQSGNIVFRTEKRDLSRLAAQIEDAVERSFGFRSEVIVRTTAEMRDVIARNPFAAREGIEPGKLLVDFLQSDPGPGAPDKIQSVKTACEELRFHGRELYIYYPEGAGRSKLSWPAIEKLLKTCGTARNWNTVVKLLEMAEKLEAARAHSG